MFRGIYGSHKAYLTYISASWHIDVVECGRNHQEHEHHISYSQLSWPRVRAGGGAQGSG